MAKHDVYMPLLIGDWLKGTRGMKAEVRGVYLSLLLFQWDNGFIPSDMEELTLIDAEVGKVWVSIKSKFKEIAPGKLKNEKMEEVRAFFSKQSDNGKKGGRPRKPKHNPNHNPNSNLHNESDIEHESVFDSEIKGGAGGKFLKVVGDDVKAELYPTFSDFWNKYDKNVARENSEILWASLLQPEKQKIMDFLEEYIPATPDKKFRLNPENFLANKSWNDEIITPNGNTGNRHQPITTDWKQVARDGEEFLRKQGLA